MLAIQSDAQRFDQLRVVDRERFPRRRLDIEHQLVRLGIYRSRSRRQGFGVAEINRARGFIGPTEPWSIAQHLALISRSEKRKAFSARGAREGKKPVAVNAGVADEELVQLFAAHALHRVTPQAFDGPDHSHDQIKRDAFVIRKNENVCTQTNWLLGGVYSGKM